MKDSFEFARIISKSESGLFIGPLDVGSFFTNVHLDETINNCVNVLFKSDSSIHDLNKKQAPEMLPLTTKESVILFDTFFYTQIDGVAMGSPLGPSLANFCPKNLNQCFTKGIQMTFLFCSKDLNM